MGDNEFRPVRYPSNTVVDGVLVPGAQAFVTAFPVGILGGVLTPTLHVAANGFVVALITFMVAFFLAWMAYRGYWTSLIELVITADLNHDGVIGPPPPVVMPPMRIDLTQMKDGARERDFIDLPFPERLPQLASGILEGRTFAQTVWSGSGMLFTKAEFEALRTELLKAGLLRWKNERAPAQGCEPTPAGRALFRKLAELHDHPPALIDR